jgi:hypothetical protein
MNFKIKLFNKFSHFETKEINKFNVIMKIIFYLNNYISEITYELFK